MVSSSLLYVAGIIFNDYFDIEIDKKERPSRPLPSGKISKQNAVTIAVSSIISANIISLAIGWMSLAVAFVLTVVIIAYDCKLKHNAIIGPITMGFARFLNVILGASFVFPITSISIQSTKMLLFIAALLFIYVIAISILSRKEVSGRVTSLVIILSSSIVFLVITSIAIAGLTRMFQDAVFVNLAFFSIVMIITFRPILRGINILMPIQIQDIIRNMVISIIILDSVFVSGIAGLPYGLATLLLIVPPILLARKLYTT
jgi:4-hydroxybenzoate polyprenyltransferase